MIWLHLNSHKNSIFTTILKFNSITQVNKMHHKKNLNIGFNKSSIFQSGTVKFFQFFTNGRFWENLSHQRNSC